MHVIKPYDLYVKYMDPKWGDRIPRAEPRTLQAGDIYDFRMADGSPVRKLWREAPPKDALTPSSLRWVVDSDTCRALMRQGRLGDL